MSKIWARQTSKRRLRAAAHRLAEKHFPGLTGLARAFSSARVGGTAVLPQSRSAVYLAKEAL